MLSGDDRDRTGNLLVANQALSEVGYPDSSGRTVESPAGSGFSGVVGFRAGCRAFLRAGVPTISLPGGLHLRTIPPQLSMVSAELLR